MYRWPGDATVIPAIPSDPGPPHGRLNPSPGGAGAQCGRPSLRVHGSEPVHPPVRGLLRAPGAPARGHHVSQRQLQVSVSGRAQGPSLQAETCGLTSLSPLGYSEASGGAGVTRGREPGLTEGVLAPPSYPSRPGLQVLEDFTLTLPPGKIVALVGQSGGGKRDRHAPPCGGCSEWSRSTATMGPSLLAESPGTRAPSVSAPCPQRPRKDHCGFLARALLRPHSGHGDAGRPGPAHPRPLLAPGPGHRLHQPGAGSRGVPRHAGHPARV